MYKLGIAARIVGRTMAIGSIAGCLLGFLFGLRFIYTSLFTAFLGLCFGSGLGLLEGLLLSSITCVFFRFPHAARVYRTLMMAAGGIIPFVGVGGFLPWYFSSTPMTPTTAVLIGSNSLLASFVGGWAGILTAENIALWYARLFRSPERDELYREDIRSAKVFFRQVLGWFYLAVFATLCGGVGERFLSFTICGTDDLRDCLPSPRLYTSMIEGYKVMVPTVAIAYLVIMLLGRFWRKCRLQNLIVDE